MVFIANIQEPSVSSHLKSFHFQLTCVEGSQGELIGYFYLKNHWGEGKAALGFGQDRIRTLVSMATYSSNRVIMWKRCCHFFSAVFHPIIRRVKITEVVHRSAHRSVHPYFQIGVHLQIYGCTRIFRGPLLF